MFTEEDQQQIIALITPILEATLARAVQTAGTSTATTTWRPGIAVAVNATTGAARVIVDGDSNAINLTIIGEAPLVGQRVMVVFVPPSAVFAFAMLSSAVRGPFTYTPTVSGWSLGNGTVTGTYSQRGDGYITCAGKIVCGSTTSFGSRLITSVPVAPAAAKWSYGGNLKDNSGSIFTPCNWRIGDGGTTTLEPFAMTGANQMNNAGLTSAIPWTWATNDEVEWNLGYYGPLPT